MNDSSNEIVTSVCDDCGTRAPGVEHTHHGAPVMFLCKNCSPQGFAAVAKRDVDEWLSGGDFNGGRQ